jgi:hypothetical protein
MIIKKIVSNLNVQCIVGLVDMALYSFKLRGSTAH